MALQLTGGSSMRVENATPFILDVPMAVGVWVALGATGSAQYVFSLSDTAGANNFLYIRISSGNLPVMGASTATDTSTTASTTALIVDGWAFILARWIATNNRKLAAISHDGVFATGSSTTTRAPSGMDKMTIGALGHNSPTLHFTGRIAEWWVTNADIQADTGHTTEQLTRKLAYEGPFSVPQVRTNLVDYRSFRKHPISDADDGSEIFQERGGRQVWTAVNGPTIGPHVPLPYVYQKPLPSRRTLII